MKKLAPKTKPQGNVIPRETMAMERREVHAPPVAKKLGVPAAPPMQGKPIPGAKPAASYPMLPPVLPAMKAKPAAMKPRNKGGVRGK